MGLLSAGERKFLVDGVAQNLRNDGRSREDFRPFELVTGVIQQANGSCRLRLGGTDVLASVRAELGKPLEDRRNQGQLHIAVEMSATADPRYEGRGGDEYGAELARALERCFFGGASGQGAALNLDSLCIAEGRSCWVVYLDALVLNTDGNVLDAIAMAFKAALSDTVLPKVEMVMGEGDDEDDDEGDIQLVEGEEGMKLDVSRVPVVITLTQVGFEHIVDATEDEESQMAAAISVAVLPNGHVAGASKRGSAGLDSSLVIDKIAAAGRLGRQLHRRLDAAIATSVPIAE
eukprot:TRINITY_DN35699_c0_g1_i1.p1 TRINITY_DN35699_c0_g1~~TRINITY_DN35699_c0_g1_i1.p1  ORF type:complete len:290 (-),score=45.08 TRINITY_DN35699_c0_g1_i1:192-1061(-)